MKYFAVDFTWCHEIYPQTRESTEQIVSLKQVSKISRGMLPSKNGLTWGSGVIKFLQYMFNTHKVKDMLNRNETEVIFDYMVDNEQRLPWRPKRIQRMRQKIIQRRYLSPTFRRRWEVLHRPLLRVTWLIACQRTPTARKLSCLHPLIWLAYSLLFAGKIRLLPISA